MWSPSDRDSLGSVGDFLVSHTPAPLLEYLPNPRIRGGASDPQLLKLFHKASF